MSLTEHYYESRSADRDWRRTSHDAHNKKGTKEMN